MAHTITHSDTSILHEVQGLEQERQLIRWGGVAGAAGSLLLISSAVVVGALGMPDASDVATLRNFSAIESGRIVEHFIYLGALLFMAGNTLVLYRMLSKTHAAAALFGAASAMFGYVIMAGSSLLHLSTAPLAELYTGGEATAEGLAAIEYAWAGAQSVFDTMLATGGLLVPVGILLLGIAMRKAHTFSDGLTAFTLGIGLVGTVGAIIAIIIPGSMWLAASVFSLALFYLAMGWRMLTWRGKPVVRT